METLKDIIQSYVEREAAYKEQLGKIRDKIGYRHRQIYRLENRERNLLWPSWVKDILCPIVDELLKRLPGWNYEILGPFGLTHETTIIFNKQEIPEEDKNKQENCLSIKFRPGDLSKGEVKLVDCSADTESFPSNSVGAVNGMNHPSIPMKETIDELFDFLCEQNEITIKS